MTYTPVYNLDTEVLLGYLGDLTLKGALLVSEGPIKIDQTLTLAIEFRQTSDKPASRMTIPARVAWCKQEEHRAYYNTGLEFRLVTDQNKKIIEEVLEKHQFNRDMPP